MNKYIIKTVELSQQSITYKVFRNRRTKNIRLYVNVLGELEVRVPRSLNDESLAGILSEHKNWILKHFAKRKILNGFYYLGKKVKVEQSRDLFLTTHHITFSNNVMKILSPANNDDLLLAIYENWLMTKAEEYIVPRAAELAGKQNYIINRINIRRQKTRWGSCSMKGNLSFNFRIMRFDKDVIDYVIIHEMCHLKEMNHSKKFWKLVEQQLPDYKKQVIKLKNLNYEAGEN